MEAANSLWIFFALTFGVVLLPGLDMAFVAGSALTAGLRGGVAAVAGIVAGGMLHVLVNAVGVSALLMLWPGAFNLLLLGGSAYMGWIGVGILLPTLTAMPQAAALADKPTAATPSAAAVGLQRSLASSVSIFAKGVLNCLLNPKAYAFMLAVFPAFLHTPQRGVAGQAVLLGAIIAGNQIAVYGLIALAAAGAQRWAEPNASAQRLIARGVGATLLVAAVFTLLGAWQPAQAEILQPQHSTKTQEGPVMTATAITTPTDGARDFDFLIGHWHVSNRRLPKHFQGSQEWETFKATQQARLLPGGIGNYDDFLPVAWRPGFVGMSLRVFNPQTQLWSIFWLSNRDGGVDASTGSLQAPVVGRFAGDTGLFYGDDMIDGRPVRVRFEWTRLNPNAARWQQAFSADAGQTWELNWVMELTRQ